jgi:hypothetical protein
MDFMERQQNEEGTDAKAILDGLVAIGFTDERMQVCPFSTEPNLPCCAPFLHAGLRDPGHRIRS